MKSTLDTKTQTHVEHTFPALYKSTTSCLVVLADSLETGIVVVGENSWNLGNYSEYWDYFDDESKWQRLPAGSSVTLIQE